MNAHADPDAIARAVLDAAVYVTLATADGEGRPWASPVFFAAEGRRHLYWVSSPDVTHSRNIAARPEVALSVFDSGQPPGTGRGLYLAATAAVVPQDEVAHGMTVYPGPAERGARRMTVEDVSPPSPYRLYRASVTAAWVLCPRPTGAPCAEHGLAHDHRTPVRL